jgi:ribosomal-protein-alanine N-acetyltransferase
MTSLIIREPRLEDEIAFIEAIRRSSKLHYPWVNPPQTPEEFHSYLNRYQLYNQKSFLLLNNSNEIIGVFNINEIVFGVFQSAYLGFYAMEPFSGIGNMSNGLKLVLHKVFTELNLHRLEANIQPSNEHSINLVTRNNFRKEGYSPRYLKINNIWCDHERWAITYEDWVVPQSER